MYLTASDEKNCTTVNKERNSSKLTTQVILVLYQTKKRGWIKIFVFISPLHGTTWRIILKWLLTFLYGVL